MDGRSYSQHMKRKLHPTIDNELQKRMTYINARHIPCSKYALEDATQDCMNKYTRTHVYPHNTHSGRRAESCTCGFPADAMDTKNITPTYGIGARFCNSEPCKS